MPTWHPFSPAELPEHSSPVLSQSKTDSSPVRGNISGPIPISSLMDDEALVENPSIGGSSSGARQALLVKSRDVGSETPATALNHPQPPLFPPDGSKRHVQIAQDARDDGRSSGAAKSSVNTPEPGHKRHRSIFSVDSTSGGGDNPQRKKSTLRGAIGRLFGRKKKTTSRAVGNSFLKLCIFRLNRCRIRLRLLTTHPR